MYYQEAKKYITESFKLSVSQWIGDGPRKKKPILLLCYGDIATNKLLVAFCSAHGSES